MHWLIVCDLDRLTKCSLKGTCRLVVAALESLGQIAVIFSILTQLKEVPCSSLVGRFALQADQPQCTGLVNHQNHQNRHRHRHPHHPHHHHHHHHAGCASRIYPIYFVPHKIRIIVVRQLHRVTRRTVNHSKLTKFLSLRHQVYHTPSTSTLESVAATNTKPASKNSRNHILCVVFLLDSGAVFMLLPTCSLVSFPFQRLLRFADGWDGCDVCGGSSVQFLWRSPYGSCRSRPFTPPAKHIYFSRQMVPPSGHSIVVLDWYGSPTATLKRIETARFAPII